MKNMVLSASFIIAALFCVSIVSAHSESIPCQDDLTPGVSPGNYSDYQDTVIKYVVSGYVKDDSGTGIQGVLVQFNSKSKNTDGTGYYQFGAPPNVEITITPSLDGYTFTPDRISLPDGVASDTTVEDFIGDGGAVSDEYIVRGTVRDENHRGMPQVQVSFNEKIKNTDEEGRYQFGVDPGVPILITPSRNGYSFVPEQINLPNGVSADLDNQDFIGHEGSVAELVTVTFSGNINVCGEALEDISVILGNDTVLTNSSGDYSITAEVELETSVDIDTYKEKYLFQPDSRSVHISDDQDQDSLDFNARYKGMQSMTGKVSHPGLGGGFAGVSVNLQIINRGEVTDTAVVTDEQGNYALPYKYGASDENRINEYWLTAEKSGYSLSPGEILFIGEDYCSAIEDHNFVATLNPVSICMVGVNDENQNMVIWEKPQSDAITYFKVFRESDLAGVYELIDSAAYEETGVFIDTISDPAVKAYRYQLSASTIHGYDTEMSGEHKSIHLTINKGTGNDWNLIWTHYEGLSFLTYKLYMGTSAGNMQFMTDIASNLTSYTDKDAPEGMIYYQIEMILLDTCNPAVAQPGLKSAHEDLYTSSRSNVVNTGGNTGISLSSASAIDLKVYPNPVSHKLTVEYSIPESCQS